ncbi:MAG: maleate cis-trans isomerase family protein [Nocardioidaceae bacterium]
MAYTVGLLYPGYGAEDDFPALEARLDGAVRLPLVHTSVGEDAHRVDALLDLGGAARLAAGARALADGHHLDSAMWACTSGSFVFGWDGARQQVDDLSELLGLPVSSTSIAFVNAAIALGVSTVVVAASYPKDVADHFVEFLSLAGIDVATMSSHDIFTAGEVGRLSKNDVLAMAADFDTSKAEALLIPDTAMHSLDWLDELEAAANRPVLTANQVTVWEGLNLLGRVPRLEGMGSLFAC